MEDSESKDADCFGGICFWFHILPKNVKNKHTNKQSVVRRGRVCMKVNL